MFHASVNPINPLLSVKYQNNKNTVPVLERKLKTPTLISLTWDLCDMRSRFTQHDLLNLFSLIVLTKISWLMKTNQQLNNFYQIKCSFHSLHKNILSDKFLLKLLYWRLSTLYVFPVPCTNRNCFPLILTMEHFITLPPHM